MEENQPELFGEFGAQSKSAPRIPGLSRSDKPILLTTSAEQLILAGILLILFGCAAFFLGVLRGKHLVVATAVPRVLAAAPSAAATSRAGVTPPVATAGPRIVTLNPQKPYTIQLASYKSKSAADAEAALLRRQGYMALSVMTRDYAVVLVGQYANSDQARRDLAALKPRYKSCYLRRR